MCKKTQDQQFIKGVYKVFFLASIAFGWSSIEAKADYSSTLDKREVCTQDHVFPDPFTSNDKAELADGEHYTLQGTLLRDSDGVHFIQVDFKEHPWLATAKRRNYPFYDLEENSRSSLNLDTILGKVVRVQGKAHGKIVRYTYQDGTVSAPQYEISVQLSADPVLVSGPGFKQNEPSPKGKIN